MYLCIGEACSDKQDETDDGHAKSLIEKANLVLNKAKHVMDRVKPICMDVVIFIISHVSSILIIIL